MDAESESDWADQLEVACLTVSRAKKTPAMVIQVTGELGGAAGGATSLVLMAKRLATARGLRYEAHLRRHVLSVSLSATEGPTRRTAR